VELSFLLDYWPLLLVLWGLNFLKLPEKVKTILSGISAALLALIIIAAITTASHWSCNNEDIKVSFNKEEISNWREISVPFDTNYILGEFRFEGGAGQFEIRDTTNETIKINTSSYTKDIHFEKTNGDSVILINYTFDSKKSFFKNITSEREAIIMLNPDIIWDLDITLGAASFESDLRKFNIRKFNIEAGAADINLQFGDKQDNSYLNISCGASNVNIEIPENIGCLINSSSGLSSTDFYGFTTKSSGNYITENYDTSKKKMIINISGGVSNFDVSRYAK
jgi:hypothetical protein